ncbi:MAG: hypothetical protein WC775_06360 [Patescibacteria group bacterium]|jgi:hypothetical protein
MVEKKKEPAQWHILKSFVFGNKNYNIGEEVPHFMSGRDKESLYIQGRIAKVKLDGTLDICNPPVPFTKNDLLTIANNPQMISYIVGEYPLFKEDLEEILATVKERVYYADYEDLIKGKIKTAPSKKQAESAKPEEIPPPKTNPVAEKQRELVEKKEGSNKE